MILAHALTIAEDLCEVSGISKLTLMENAGRGAYEALKEKCRGKRVIIFCGHGNNGGDGFVLARYLASETNVIVAFFGNATHLKSEAKKNFDRLGEVPVQIIHNSLHELQRVLNTSSLVLVDALLGTGINGGPREPIASAIHLFNSVRAQKFSLDIPSGLDPDKGVVQQLYCKPDIVIAFADQKRASREFQTHIIDIGIPRALLLLANLWAHHRPDAHKGDNGKVLVIGGNTSTSGAVALAGIAAFRAGADYVGVVCPKPVAQAIRCLTPDLVCHPMEGKFLGMEHFEDIKKLSKRYDTVLIGMGIGGEESTKKLIKALVQSLNLDLVIDAEALRVIGFDEVNHAILTPHLDELFSLLENSKTVPAHFSKEAQKTAVAIQPILRENVLVLKGMTDYIVSRNAIEANTKYSPRMAIAGTGDVLAGLVSGLVAQGAPHYDAALIATYLNGRVGEMLFEKKKYCFLASDLVEDMKKLRLVKESVGILASEQKKKIAPTKKAHKSKRGKRMVRKSGKKRPRTR